MPGGSQGTASGVLRSSAAIGAALVLAVSAFVAQTPQTVAAAGRGCVTPGNDGPNAALTGVVNSYYPATASATAGAAAISVGTRIPALSPAIAPGDLLLVIQMQDADISGTNAITYGDGATGRGSTGLRSTGLYEYVAATSAVVAGSVTIAGSGAGGGLVNSYDFSTTVTATNGFRTFQVIRVPQYSSATITAGLTAAAWDGAAHAGGVLAIDVAGALNLNTQTISVNQLGFKGGLGVQKGGGPGGTGTDYVVPSSSLFHGYKAEGIAGTPRFLYDAIAAAAVTGAADGYPSGDAARGAPGTAGGGGTDANPAANNQNTGGGGGANGGQGGMGGNSWNSNQPVGGLGGAAFPATAARVVLGGGGGAGSRNDSPGIANASSGGTGGGIVMIRAGSLAGTGTITANGGTGVTPDNDGGGGGGAGGSVIVSAGTGTVNGLTINAVGGRGTDAWPSNAGGLAARHGPGGGGGGGLIITSNALPAGQTSVVGGAHGITTTLSDAYGSTDGNPGAVQTTTAGAIPGSSSGAECLPVLTVAKSTSTPSVINSSAGTTATYSITVSNTINTSPATNLSVADALPTGFTYAATVGVVLSAGATRPATVNPVAGDTNPTFGTFTIPGGGSVVITFTVNIASTVAPGTYNNPAAATYLNPTRTTTTGTTSTSYPGGGLDRVTVAILLPDLTVAKSHTDPFVRGSTTSTYTVTASNVGTAPTSGVVTVTDTLPAGLTPTAAAGTGWTCPPPAGQTVTCTRSTVLAAGGAYPAITITVTVLQTAPNSVVNQAVVSGGGETNTANNTANDPTNIISLPGLPNTAGPPPGSAPGASNFLVLAALAVIACVGVMAIDGRSLRFRHRRRRPNFRAISVLLCVVACSPLSSALMSPSAPMAAAAPIAEDAVAEVIADTVVTKAKPAPPPVEESFHLAAGPITPSRLRIPSISIDAPVASVGLLSDGSMAVPDNLWVSAWLSSGARPGQAGSTVIAGHRGISTPGLFGHLENVRQGDVIRVSDAGGGELAYQVTRVASLDLTTATQMQVFGPTTQQQLVLITCFGQYLPGTRTYDHRLVVFSRLLPGAA